MAVTNLPLADAMAKVNQTSRITEDQLFDVWLRLPGERSLRAMSKLLKSYGHSVGVLELQRLATKGQWVQKGLAAQLVHDAETNRLAYETIRDRQVRRRAESLEILGETFDHTLRAARDLVRGDGFKKHVKANGNPKELGQLIKALQSMATLFDQVMPHYTAGDADTPEGLLDGPINPLQLASQLQRLSARKPVLTIRGDAVDITPDAKAEPAGPPDAP